MLYIVETVATASIREFWRVDAEGESEARAVIEGDASAELAEFIFDEVLGDEEGREVRVVHSGDDAAGLLALHRAERAAAAPAASATIRTCTDAAALIRDSLLSLDAAAHVDDGNLEDGRLTIIPHEGAAFRVNVTIGER